MADDLNLSQPQTTGSDNLPVGNPIPPPPPPPAEIPGPTLPPEPPPAELNLNPEPPPSSGGPSTEPPLIVATPPSNKFPLKKIFAPIAVFLLLVSIPVAVFLVQQRQEVREKAAEPADCDSRGGFSGWGVDCDCGRMQPYGEKVNVVICNDGTHLPNTATGEQCDPGVCTGGDKIINNCLRKDCDTVNFTPGHLVCIELWQKPDGSTYEKPGVDTGQPCTAGGGWHQCLYTDRDEPPENLPCGSCAVTNVGAGTMNFGCELDCGGSASRCPGGQAGSYSIAHRWERCTGKGTQACTGSSPDYVESADLGGPGPWTISGQSTTTGSGTFPNPGCGRVQVDVQMPQTGTSVSAQVFDTGQDCAGPQPTPTSPPPPTEPPTTPQCRQIKTYDTNWNALSASQLSQLKPGDKVRFATLGQPATEFTKARFRVNQSTWQETVIKKPNTNEFYFEYTVPTNVTNFKVEAEVYHSDQGWK